MNIRLDGKNALVCGCSQGIGKAIAIQFAEMGANVILTARNSSMLNEVLNQLKKIPGQEHLAVPADFSHPEKAISIINEFINNKTIHILINNSGGPAPGPIHTAEPESFFNAFNQHLIMNQLLIKKILPGMKKENFGRIINIISISVKQPVDNLGVSNTIRGAMSSWSKTLSKEVAQYGITVNNILPGYTMTSRLNSLMENNAANSGKSVEKIASEIISNIPAGRLALPEEPAYLAGFLASDYASYITGVNIPVDGGYLKCL
ncbi:MAG: SDR family oxidoreductase [FCB group bacterium]|jgi:3-oxoacyl-[acyl-carrier protein] reductase